MKWFDNCPGCNVPLRAWYKTYKPYKCYNLKCYINFSQFKHSYDEIKYNFNMVKFNIDMVKFNIDMVKFNIDVITFSTKSETILSIKYPDHSTKRTEVIKTLSYPSLPNWIFDYEKLNYKINTIINFS